MIDTKPYIESLNGKPVAVFGLGLSGLSTARALMKSGGDVHAWDDDAEKRAKAEKEGVRLADFAQADLSGYGALILSPGVPLYFPAPHPVVEKARAAGVEIYGDLEILHRSRHGLKTVGITGTNGKSTTTALTGHILNAAGRKAVTAGNIGKPVLDMELPEGGTIVLEISSYQMDLCPTFRPDIGVLLNITPDHLDRHGSMEAYIAAKEKIFDGSGIVICGMDDAPSQSIHDRTIKSGGRRTVPVSVKKDYPGGVYAKEDMLIDCISGEPVEITSLKDLPTLPGLHNKQNICAAYAACRALGLVGEEIAPHLKTYPGLAHRQFPVRTINGVLYINDSKATNAESTANALSCYNNIYLIAGGKPKEGGLGGLESLAPRIRHVFLIGEAADDFAHWFHKFGVPFTKSGVLQDAVAQAHAMAQGDRGQPGGANVVLLSPACASYDQFRNFEHRGEVFTEIVNALPEDAP
jgi:UDP-N-acetylmuramoylalanine--D-glutamate ligase